MSNFQFLKKEFPAIYQEAAKAEKHTFQEPRFSALLSRSAMEKTIFWLYKNDPDLQLPYDTKLGALLHHQDFKEILKPSMFHELDVIRLTGNNAAHGKKVSQYESLQALKNLFRFLSFLSVYYSEENPQIPPFDEKLLQHGTAADRKYEELKRLAEKLEKELEQEKAEKLEKEAALDALEKLRQQQQEAVVKERKEDRKKRIDPDKAVPPLTSEMETRKQLIDLLLKEAGWDALQEGKDKELEVQGMPLSTNPSGVGYIDYVLWGRNGLPLAVVEAKKTLFDAAKGKHQASLYADCLEKSFGQRPIIFYSNGFETYLE